MSDINRKFPIRTRNPPDRYCEQKEYYPPGYGGRFNTNNQYTRGRVYQIDSELNDEIDVSKGSYDKNMYLLKMGVFTGYLALGAYLYAGCGQ